MLEIVENYAKEKRDNNFFYELLAQDLEDMPSELKEQAREIFSSLTISPNAMTLEF